MKLIDFWPPVDSDHTGQCLFTEAETAAEAVFLAVHQPMTLLKTIYRAEGATPEKQTEKQVLKALLAPNPTSGTLIVPIIGNSGVGKSHMIRWLHAHLKLDKDRAKRHIVRIPKSASLRKVLDLILEELSGDKYAGLKESLQDARLPEDQSTASILLQTQLRIELTRVLDEATERLNAQSPLPDDRSRKTHCSEFGLGALLIEPEIQKHFLSCEGEEDEWGVIARIAHRFVEGTRKNDNGERNEFFPQDFDFIKKLDLHLLGEITRRYIGILLTQPKSIDDLVGFLNEVLEPARAGLIDSGGVSLAELFTDIRKALLDDGKELILLVEDFAVLAGIQKPLLDAMIKEAFRDGEQELCVMRTALAVTEGRLSEETVMTRARASWKIQSRPFASEEEAMELFSDFVGGYLNAARWGAKKLDSLFLKRDPNAGVGAWVPNYYVEHESKLAAAEKEQLDAFTYSPSKHYPLFPFNPGAIRQLARQYLREGELYKFDPRLLINQVLRETVIGGRDLFEKAEFPSSDFQQFEFTRLQEDVESHLQSKIPENYIGRVAATYFFWGDSPESRGHAAAMDVKVLDAFSLPHVENWNAKVVEKAPIQKPGTSPKGTGPPTHEPAIEIGGPLIAGLKRWRTNNTIGQTDAKNFRNALAEGINAWMDQDSLLHPKAKIVGASIFLPQTDQGLQDADRAVVIAATDEDLDDQKRSSLFFLSMRSVARFEHQKNWDYPDGLEDYVLYANLMESLANKAERHIRDHGVKPSSFPKHAVKPLAKALMLDARLLNLEGASANTDEANLAAMLDPGQSLSHSFEDTDDRWKKLVNNAQVVREELRDLLLENISARQGGGGTQAVDACQLLEALRELRSESWQLGDDADLSWNDLQTANAKSHIKSELRKRLPGIVAGRSDAAGAWRDQVVAAFGEEFEINELLKTLKDTITVANRVTYRCSKATVEQLRAQISNLGPLKATFDDASRASIEAIDLGAKISALAQLDDSIMSRVTKLIESYQCFLTETGAEADADLKDAPRSLEDTASEFDKELEKLASTWTQTSDLCK